WPTLNQSIRPWKRYLYHWVGRRHRRRRRFACVDPRSADIVPSKNWKDNLDRRTDVCWCAFYVSPRVFWPTQELIPVFEVSVLKLLCKQLQLKVKQFLLEISCRH